MCIMVQCEKALIEVKCFLPPARTLHRMRSSVRYIDAYCASMHKSCAFVTANEVPSNLPNLPKLHSNTSTRSSSAKPSEGYGKNHTSKIIRFKNDLDRASSILSGLENTIQAQSVSDVVRMGRYNPDRKRPRPILVKLLWSAYVSTVLTRRRSLPGALISHQTTPVSGGASL